MSPKDVLEVCASIIASLGGGAAIVFGLSGYLGKVWAERGLAKQRQDYAQLNIAFSNQLDIATRRLQIALDAIGHLHRLTTQDEFDKIQELWKRIVVLRTAFYQLPSDGRMFMPIDAEVRKELNLKNSEEFLLRCNEAQQFLNEQALSIPKHIADAGNRLLRLARFEGQYARFYPDPPDSGRPKFDNNYAEFFRRRNENFQNFEKGTEELEGMMREYRLGSGWEPLAMSAAK
jgi:hypothetical protein